MSIKTELIIGAFAKAYPAETGVYPAEELDYEKIYENLIIAPRFTLEKNSLIRHLISYFTITRVRDDGVKEYLVYQRPEKNNGEVRLAGNHSIGFGGHTEALEISNLLDFSHCGVAAEAIAYLENVQTSSTLRELNEELNLVSGDKFSTLLKEVTPPHSLIIDNTDDVGLHHVGVVSDFIITSDEIQFKSGEDQIDLKGWFTLEQIQENFGSTLENWSKMLLAKLLKD